ncbi:MAG TPA: UbiH/UbiF/VisC/COQ6 family ubiquinone biosynthesis hydroxylase [Alphaproteobacteria bacterium]|nr:UbiH/UbiF/VisC/COQ6 family ubiquinone biosynthesis hydroxylase [Alphaproteobacteria bacterium]
MSETTPTPPALPANPDLRCDVAIVGGGLAGLSLAAALGQAGTTVVCIDRDPPALHLTERFDGRTTAVAAGSRRLLDAIGVWDLVAAEAAAIREIRVADNNAPLFLHFDHRELGDEVFGHIVENRHLRRGLLERLAALRNTVTHLAPVAATGVARGPDGATVTLADGRTVAARLVVGADGRNSAVRAGAGITTTGWRYDQDAIVCTVEHEAPHNGIAIEHFMPAGPFAILPMTGNRSSIVWTERAKYAARFVALPDDDFAQELGRRFGDFWGRVAPVGPRFRYPLGLMLADSFTAERLALVGEAARAMHPIAGQGLNVSWRDVAALAEAVVDARRLGLDAGSAAVLDRYARWRRVDSVSMLAATDLFNRLFSNDFAPLKLARDLGLAAVGRIPPLKQFFMRHAMGVGARDLPRLVRGEAL